MSNCIVMLSVSLAACLFWFFVFYCLIVVYVFEKKNLNVIKAYKQVEMSCFILWPAF